MATDCPNPDADGTTEAKPPRATCYINVDQPPLLCKIMEEQDTQGHTELDVEVWDEPGHPDARIYLSGSGDLHSGGTYRAGFEMRYIQARRLRDQLDEALEAFE